MIEIDDSVVLPPLQGEQIEQIRRLVAGYRGALEDLQSALAGVQDTIERTVWTTADWRALLAVSREFGELRIEADLAYQGLILGILRV